MGGISRNLRVTSFSQGRQILLFIIGGAGDGRTLRPRLLRDFGDDLGRSGDLELRRQTRQDGHGARRELRRQRLHPHEKVRCSLFFLFSGDHVLLLNGQHYTITLILVHFRIENGLAKPRFDLGNESDSEDEYDAYNKRCRLC